MMMAQLAIKGHATRGKEVIEILEMLGGKNRYHFKGDEDEWFVLNGNIQRTDRLFTEKGFTLEEFLEKYPYKVGDKVRNIIHNENQTITDLVWGEDEVLYQTSNNEYVYVNYLQPYKEEIVDTCCCSMPTIPPSYKLSVKQLEEMNKTIVFGNDSPDETELVLGDNYEVKVKDGKTYVVKKEPKYPKTYEKCRMIINATEEKIRFGYKSRLLSNFQQLLICRDAYWKLAGDWKPYWSIYDHKFCIGTDKDKVIEECVTTGNRILAFPTKEMRDVFYENFKELIESVKELI